MRQSLNPSKTAIPKCTVNNKKRSNRFSNKFLRRIKPNPSLSLSTKTVNWRPKKLLISSSLQKTTYPKT